MKEDIDRILTTTPLLKAKDIAREIGVTRKEVNSFLHSHQDCYKKDAEFRWQRIEGGELVLTLPPGWLTGGEFEAILQAEGQVLTSPTKDIKIVTIEKHRPELWIHGHTHVPCDYELFDTRIVCNPRGYPREVRRTEFRDNLVVSVGR